MKNEIKEYLSTLEHETKSTKKETHLNELLTRISFYQHERLIHLIVTFFTGISAILFFLGFLILESLPLLILFILTLLLFIPYIFHYYFLENSVQKLYQIYYKIYSKKD